MHFSHANGLPSLTYSYLFEQLVDFDVRYIECMGYASHQLSGNWYDLADELITSIILQQVDNDHQQPVIGVGHSAGAVVTLLAACKRPELFSHVILLDPVLFGLWKRSLVGLLRTVGLIDNWRLVKQARARRAKFTSVEQAREYFSAKRFFKHFHPRCFDSYIQFGLKSNENGLELAISPEQEAQIFRSVIFRVPARISNIKGTLIYGKHSDVIAPSDIRWWYKNLPFFNINSFDGGHLFPLEQPDETIIALKKALLA